MARLPEIPEDEVKRVKDGMNFFVIKEINVIYADENPINFKLFTLDTFRRFTDAFLFARHIASDNKNAVHIYSSNLRRIEATIWPCSYLFTSDSAAL